MENSRFNNCVTKAQAQKKDTIGMLKNRFCSLKEIRLHTNGKQDMTHYIKWVYTCVIFHNMLAKTGKSWEDNIQTDPNVATIAPKDHLTIQENEKFHAIFKKRCPEQIST
jgi:hypothetical protein